MCSVEVPLIAVHRFREVGPVVRECYVDADDAAAFLGVKRSTVLRWARAGRIPAHILHYCERRAWRFQLSELDAWVRQSDLYCPQYSIAGDERRPATVTVQ